VHFTRLLHVFFINRGDRQDRLSLPLLLWCLVTLPARAHFVLADRDLAVLKNCYFLSGHCAFADAQCSLLRRGHVDWENPARGQQCLID